MSDKKDNCFTILDDMTECCGCFACFNACPKRCIIKTSDERGFLYPMIEYNKCLYCKNCIKVCPIRNEKAKLNLENKR